MSGVFAKLGAPLIAALLLAGMQRFTPGYAEITGPIPLKGDLGETLTGRGFTVRADKVLLAEKLRFKAYGREVERDTGGVFALVIARLDAQPVSTTVSGAIWRSAQGARFVASPRFQGAPRLLGTDRLEPGLPQRGVFIFEVPREAVAGATLLVAASRWPRLDTQAEIALPATLGTPASLLDLNELAYE
ncbi:hypothetical protein ASE66_14310 [Bosea sp. Root483D1]|uniref:hypothetical protein n=1 Tax=Bosea sp. Root483D1 TaxID=1736544 RepID=UPI000710A256|nr:hypothetical protein [Bosea sp. Root483D1]KRE14536.1 hypothetical protein ASE66_14310 [Bosea sp. Root483D1]